MANSNFKSAARRAASNMAVIVLLGAILLALVVLIGIVVLGGKDNEDRRGSSRPALGPGETRQLDPSAQATMKPVGDPQRIKEVLQAGKTYRTIAKAGFEARVEDKDWGIKQVTNLAYVVEAQVTRKIESNDGHRVVELRTFETLRNAKILFQVEGVTIDLGSLGTLVLGAIELKVPGTIAAVATVKPLVEQVLTGAAQAVADDTASKAFAYIDTLSGKTVRITYVDDGRGVESIVPIGCTLTADEADFVMASAALSDCYLLPDVNVKPGQTWKVDGRQFAGFIDPTLRSVPTGEIEIRRAEDEDRNGKHIAKLAIDHGYLELNASDSSTQRVGSFTPRGTLDYDISDGFTEAGQLEGDMRIEQVSQDHILFEASFRTQPKIQIQYSCEIIP